MAPHALRQNQLDFLISGLRAMRAGLWRDVPPRACYTDDLGLESVDLLELAARIEHRCGVNVPDVELD